MTDIIMYDTVTIDTVPPNPVAVAGYTSGSWPTYEPLVRAFPHAIHVSINISTRFDGMALDCEPGDVPPTAYDEIATWVRRQNGRQVTPLVYASLSNAQGIVNGLGARGLVYGKNYYMWSAHYTFRQHRCSPACGFGFREVAHATQFTDRALGRNLDASLVDAAVFSEQHPTKPPDPYSQFYNKAFTCKDIRTGKDVRLNERQTVIEFDKAIAHPIADPKKTIDLWYDLVALRKRIWVVAHTEKDNKGHLPSWGSNNRGSRWHAINHRSNGLN